MRRPALLLVAAVIACSFASTPANATVNCADIGPVPGYGPVCLVRCLLTTDPEVNPKDVIETVGSVIPICTA